MPILQGAAAVARIEAEMRSVLVEERPRPAMADERAGGERLVDPLYGMMAYHLGWVDAAFAPEAGDGGKKLRGQLCLLACAAAGGESETALPLAAAVELLHNFTLVHDDIQDRSDLRRHRQTVWSRWGVGQAINVGDGLYALARLALLRLLERGVAPALVVELSTRLEQTLLRILEGQYLDLSFEADWSASEPLYLRMIEGKTASLLGYCLAAGARLGGADGATTQALGRCGLALGLGFQVRDDILGIWGAPEVTGKPPAADIRARKKSLPLLIALERARPDEAAALEAAYAQAEPDEAAVARVLAVLERTGAAERSQTWVATYHQAALAALDEADQSNEATRAIRQLAEGLIERQF